MYRCADTGLARATRSDSHLNASRKLAVGIAGRYKMRLSGSSSQRGLHRANAVPNRSSAGAEECRRQALRVFVPSADAERTLAPEAPVDSFGFDAAGDMLAEVTLEGGFPGHKGEAETVIDHGKSARCQTESRTVETGDRFARFKRSVRKAVFDCDIRGRSVEVALPQGIDELPGEDDALPIATG